MKSITLTIIALLMVPVSSFAAQTGGGFTVYDQVNVISGSVTGGGISTQSGSNPVSSTVSGGGYSANIGSNLPVETSTAVTPTVTPSSGGGGGGGGGSNIVPEILETQKILTILGYKTPVDGVYSGPYKQGLADFQTATGIPVTGVLDTTTKTELQKQLTIFNTKNETVTTDVSSGGGGSACSKKLFTKPLKIGAVGFEVISMQNFLNKQGFKTPAIGVFGESTRESVKKFQARYAKEILVPTNSPAPTGYWYSYTISKANAILCPKAITKKVKTIKVNTAPSLKAITSIDSTQKTTTTTEVKDTSLAYDKKPVKFANSCDKFTVKLKKGAVGTEVDKMVDFLITQGYNIPSLGIFGPVTELAVKAFQAKYFDEILSPVNELAPTGLWYELTMKKANSIKCDSSTTQ